MADFRSRNRLLLAKIQAAEGTEEAPTPGANAIKVNQLEFSPNLEQLSRDDEVSGSLSVSAPLTGGGMVAMRGGFYLKGAGTAGQAPEYDPILRACGFSVTTTAAALTGTAQAGSTSSITLAAAGTSAVNDAYKGMVIRATGGAGNGQSAVISAYNGSTKVATLAKVQAVAFDVTTQYSIDANVLYKPVSTGLEFITMWGYDNNNNPAVNSRRFRLFDGMGTWSMSLSTRNFGRFNFTMTGKLPANPDNVSAPSAPTYSVADPQAFLNAEALLGGAAVKFSDFSLDAGNEVSAFDDPSAAFGYDSFQVTQRKPVGSIKPNLVLISSRDAFADWVANTVRPVVQRYGSAAGRRVSIFMPAIKYTGYSDADVRGYRAEQLPFQATGNDGEVYICVH